MATVLHILQIIGISILILLAIIFLLFIFILIDPIRYKLILDYDAYDTKEEIGCLKLNWLLNIVRCNVYIGLKGIKYDFRLFGFKSNLLDKYLGNDKEDTEDKVDSLEVKNEEDANKNIDTISDNLYNNEDKIKEIDKETNKIDVNKKIIETKDDEKEVLDDIEEIWEDLVSDTPDIDTYDKKEKKSLFKTLFNQREKFSFKKILPKYLVKKIISFLKNIFKGIKGIIRAIIKTIKVLMRKYELVITLWEKKSTQIAIERIKRYVFKLCRHILPRKKKINIRIGFEDPAQTGYVLAGLGIIYGALGNILNVKPNFEDKECKIDGYFIGKMNLITLGIIFMKIVRDKAIKRLLNNIDKLKEDISNVG